TVRWRMIRSPLATTQVKNKMYEGRNNVAGNAEQDCFARTKAAAAQARADLRELEGQISSGLSLFPAWRVSSWPARSWNRDRKPRSYKPARRSSVPIPERTVPGCNWWWQCAPAPAQIP